MNIEKEIKTLKQQVEFVLENYPETRNSDKLLTITIWRVFHKDLLRHIDRIGEVVPLLTILDLPGQDGIKRTRAHTQNKEKRFLPTDKDVALERGWRESDWKVALGYRVEDPGQMHFAGV